MALDISGGHRICWGVCRIFRGKCRMFDGVFV